MMKNRIMKIDYLKEINLLLHKVYYLLISTKISSDTNIDLLSFLFCNARYEIIFLAVRQFYGIKNS